jgi:hypothetical protein
MCNLEDAGCAWEICAHYGGARHLCDEAEPLCRANQTPMAWKLKDPTKVRNPDAHDHVGHRIDGDVNPVV